MCRKPPPLRTDALTTRAIPCRKWMRHAVMFIPPLDRCGTNWFHICVSDVFDAIAHPARRALLDELRAGPARAGDLGQDLGISREAVSKHLRLMAQAGALEVTTKGRERYYAISPAGVGQIDSWLEPYRAFWNQRLDALETEIARGRRRRNRAQTATTPQPVRQPKGA